MRKGGLYLAIGDSVTWTMPESVPNASGSQLYAGRLWEKISKDYAPIKHINKGIGGSNSDHLVKNLRWLLTSTPDLVTIGIGMNDSNGQAISVANYKTNLQTVIDFILKRNPKAIIICCTPNRATDPGRTPYLDNYRNAMAEVVTGYNLPNIALCRFETAWTDDAANLEPVGMVHPNPTGHGNIFNVLWPVVQSVASDWLNSLGK
jgi:lysophospholipase L1-like esterase